MRNSSRTWLAREMEVFGKQLPEGSLVLDAGAGEQPYRECFKHCRYEAADFERVDKPYAQSTYVCDLSSIPVEEGRFDAVVFNQVMEHLPDPLKVLRELRRVLKTGGIMFCSAPLFYEEHEQPYDFYRYTQFGWRYLMETADFKVERLDWLEGYLGTLAYQLYAASRHLPRTFEGGGLRQRLFLKLCRRSFKILAQRFYRMDETSRYTRTGYPKNYIVVVRRPE